MCGITGFYSVSKKFSEQELHAMTDAVAHRGPDATGYFMEDMVGFGHRRLSILDLSENANQPMFSHDQRYVMVYNGEVYNYQEIAAELKYSKNIIFKTSSDSEVILEAFVYYGADFVHKLNGMFAIAIYDRHLNELYLFRDRLGIKPLYYFWDGENFAFASELKSLLKLKAIKKKINTNAIAYFLHLGFIPAPLSIYEGINKLMSGSFLKVFKNNLTEKKYWSVENILTNNVVTEEKQAIVILSDLLMSSVQYQLKSDVPFGVFLSGGIDSSLITALAVNLAGIKVNTFSIGFEENRYSESIYAKDVANYLGTSHHEFIVSYKNAIELIDKMFVAYDEPFSDSSAIPTMLVSKLAKQYVTVTLSGEGGDELFYGYGAYNWARRLDNPMVRTFRKPIGWALSHMSSRYKRAGKLFDYKNHDHLKSHIFSQEQYLFSEDEIVSLLTPDYKMFSEMNYFSSSSRVGNVREFGSNINQHIKERSLNSMEQQSLYDIQYYLRDDLLTKVDRASMQYSLETRVPYLDHRVVECAVNLSPRLKVKGSVNKYILKEILFQYVPKKYFQRPKQGFAIPLSLWLKNELSYLIHENLSKEVVEMAGMVRFEEVKKLLKGFHEGDDFLYNRIWLLIVLHRWYLKNTALTEKISEMVNINTG